jgi:serine protease Do
MKTTHLLARLALAAVAMPFVGFAQAAATLPDFTEIYEKQGAAVVSIQVLKSTKRNAQASPFGNRQPDPDDPMFEFFRRFMPPGQGGDTPRSAPRDRERTPELRPQGAGSGFLISNDGFIVTNHHVVDGADELNVTLTDKREFKAKVIGSDSRTDTALLKIEASSLPKVTIGDPNKMKVGEWVAAIGQPFGLENTLTKGVVSAKGRSNIGDQNNLVSFIQHDAAVNPGNSGGPLFNHKGEVVAINSMIFTRSGGFQGLSFAIPIDTAMDVVKQLQNGGKVNRGRIGVAIGPVSKDLAESFNLPKATGALVASVEKDSAADKAGVKQGDVILKFDGKAVNESSDLPRIVTSVKPGIKTTVEIWRGGKSMSLPITVGEAKVDTAEAKPEAKADKPAAKTSVKTKRIELSVAELTEADKKQYEVKNGVLIEEARKGVRNLEEGDVILAVTSKGNTTDINSAEQLNNALSKVEKNSSVAFHVKRGKNTLIVTEKLSD